MEKILTLLDLQRQAQEAPTLSALGHVVVNKTRELIEYDEAVFWTCMAGNVTLEAVAGNATIDHKGPFAQALKTIIGQALGVINPGQEVFRPPASALATYLERKGGSALIGVFQGRNKEKIGGVWLYREKEFTPAEEHILAELSRGYAVALMLLRTDTTGNSWKDGWRQAGRVKKIALIACLVLAFLPVRLSVTAPAEITARNASILTAPFEGIVENINVQPGEEVKQGQVIAVMEQTVLRSRMEMAQEALSMAQSSLARLRRDALGNPDKRIEMSALQSDITLKKLEYDHAAALLARSEMISPRDGIAIFSDKNAIMGRPVSTGAVIMQIADPAEKELLVRIPVDSLIPFSLDSRMSFHLNVSPLNRNRAQIISMGYQASPDPDGLLTYKVRASLPDDSRDSRIGWKGTATIKGGWTILSYAIARRPLAAARRMTGL